MRPLISLFVLVFLLTGCAGISYEKAEQLPAGSLQDRNTTLNYAVELRGFEDRRGKSGLFRAPFDQVHEGDLVAALTHSHRFANLQQGASDSGYSVKVNTFVRHSNRNASQILDGLSILSLTIIPFRATQEVISDVELSHNGQVIETSKVHEFVNVYVTITLPHGYLFGRTTRSWEKSVAQKISNKIVTGIERYEQRNPR